MIVKNLAGIFSGEGFVAKKGRRPSFQDCGARPGPLDLCTDDSGKIRPSEHGTSPGNETLFDGSGLWASAGFVDSHTHTLFSGSRASEYFLRWKGASYKEVADSGGGIHNSFRDTLQSTDLEDTLLQGVLEAARFGITSLEVKSGYGGTAEAELRLLRIIKGVRDRLGSRGPRVGATFLALHALPKGRTENAFVDEMISVLPQIQAEGLAEFADAFPEAGFFTLAESLRFAKAAQAHGLKLKIHADELSPLGSAEAFAGLGALSVDHLQKIGDVGVATLAQSETVACLLPATSFYLALEYTNARRLWDAGAQVALATDYNPGTAPSPSFSFTQLLAASQMKMSAAEILCASTYNGAAAMGLKNTGALVPGSAGDFCLWKLESKRPADALEEIIVSAAKPVAVFRDGRQIA